LLAYKDEYEVARLYTDPAFRASLDEAFEGALHLLAPPIFGGRAGADGNPRKREFGPWIFPVLRLLAKCRGLRGLAALLQAITIFAPISRESSAIAKRISDDSPITITHSLTPARSLLSEVGGVIQISDEPWLFGLPGEQRPSPVTGGREVHTDEHREHAEMLGGFFR
jgi:hypothetical protein